MAQLLLAHDLGTTGNKATLYDPEGKLLAGSFSGYGTHYGPPGQVEQDPADWWRAVCESTRELIAASGVGPGEIACVSFSGQMMGCLPVGADGRPLRRSIIWADQRAVPQAERLVERVGRERGYAITGHRLSPSYSAAKAMWLAEHEPEVVRRARCFLQAKDYAVFRLTGTVATDYSDASGTNLFDLQRREWSAELFEAAGLDPAQWPALHPAATVVGEVTPEAAEETLLRSGTPVAIGGGDGSCAAVGAGVVREGAAYSYIGSSSWVALASREPLADPKLRTVTFHHLPADLLMPTGTMQAAGGSYQWLAEVVCDLLCDRVSEEGYLDTYEYLDDLADGPPMAGAPVLFLPYLLGERSPHWNPDARGVFIGMTPETGLGSLARAVLDGVALNLGLILDIFRELGAQVEAVRLIGGGAKSRLWRQIMADVHGVPVRQAEHLEEATSLGAAICGGVAVGLYRDYTVAEDLVKIVAEQRPDAAATAYYQRLKPIFAEAYEALKPTFEALANLPARD